LARLHVEGYQYVGGDSIGHWEKEFTEIQFFESSELTPLYEHKYINIYIYIYIHGVPGGKDKILEGHSIGHSKQKRYTNMCPIPNGFRDRAILVVWLGRQVLSFSPALLREGTSIFWEVILSVILSKKLYINMCPIPNGFRDRAI
jgi:hypothetical protein